MREQSIKIILVFLYDDRQSCGSKLITYVDI